MQNALVGCKTNIWYSKNIKYIFLNVLLILLKVASYISNHSNRFKRIYKSYKKKLTYFFVLSSFFFHPVRVRIEGLECTSLNPQPKFIQKRKGREWEPGLFSKLGSRRIFAKVFFSFFYNRSCLQTNLD